MHLNKLSLKHYRNYEGLELDFNQKINVLIGENAQGKTNILESIYMLALARSHRTTKSAELIQWGQETAKIEGIIEKKNTKVPLELIISKKEKKARVNHLNQSKLSQYVGHMNVVMFAPEDLTIVKGMPQVRRRFLDVEIGQISPIYIYEVTQYNKVLQQKNALLKTLQSKRSSDTTMLEIYNEQLISHGSKILEKRFEFLETLKKRANDIHRGISDNKEELNIEYQSSLDVSESFEMSKIIERFEEKFDKIKEKEIERGTALIGPQRDDLVFYVNEKNVQTFGSQGQQRTTALSLKLAEIELIFGETNEYPILLLDDVLSELDDSRQSHLLETIKGKVQTFITTTNIDGIDHETLKEADKLTVQEGTVLEAETMGLEQ